MVKQDKIFTKIAQEHLRIETLETRHRDCLDFHEVSVASLRDALEAAFLAGQTTAAKAKISRRAISR